MYRDKEKGTRLEGGAEELKALQDAKKPKHEKPAWGGGIAQVPTLPTMPLYTYPRHSLCRCAALFVPTPSIFNKPSSSSDGLPRSDAPSMAGKICTVQLNATSRLAEAAARATLHALNGRASQGDHDLGSDALAACVQMREREQQQEELRQQAARPFARTADDADRDMGLRERVRFGDPFADKLARMRPAALPAPIVPAHMRKQMKKSGFVVPHVS